MTVDEIYQDIAKQKAPIIYASGKTSIGKSTFGRRLRGQLDYQVVELEVDYQVVELEVVLLEIVKKRGFDEQTTFRNVLYDSGDLKPRRYG